ncbi:MAG: EpsG family protein [Candidatus Omnitrophota bacterium]
MNKYDYTNYLFLYFPYHVLFAFLVGLSLFFDFHKTSRSLQQGLFFLLIILLSVFCGTRVGWSDQDGYMWIFDMVPPLPGFLTGQTYVPFRIEYLYLLLNSFVKCFSQNPMVLFLTVASGVVTMNLWAYRKYSPYFFLTVLAYYSNYYFVGTMTAMRQGIATGIVLCAVSLLTGKKDLAFIVFVMVAAMFHFSAIFALFGYVVYRLNFSSRVLYCLVLGSLALGIFSPVSHWLFSHFLSFSNLNPQIETGLSYLENESQGFALGVLRPTSLKQLMICLLAIRYRETLGKQMKYFEVLFLFYCGATIWRFLFNDVAVLAARVAGLLSLGEPVLIVSFLLLFKHDQRRWIALGIILLAAGSLYLNFITFNYPPYVSALFGGMYWKEGFFGI